MEIFQPFAQYRNAFTFDYAQSYPLPPKSTIIGMLQNATGKYYDEELYNLKVSVHGLFESKFWNYQSLIKGEVSLRRRHRRLELWNAGYPLYSENIKSQRSPTYQEELFNGHYYIFLKGDKNMLLEVEESLSKPSNILYLGRSEDIIFIKNMHKNFDLKEKKVKRNIWLTYPTYIKLEDNGKTFPLKNRKFPVYSIPLKVLFKNKDRVISNKAELSNSTDRVPEFESVIYTGTDQVIYLEDKVTVEEYHVGGLVFKISKNFGWL
ncbi:type I-B CRISPR-associated protein Cas5b [Methanothermobacter tenebrarum]|nr:type I-B CRISPR-associated protein Cas5b [Methanothermobacter tenebrarum]MBC7101162.1 type I-B CRISPR-associated protein Cas5 [Methanobacteriales archaeon]